MTLLCLSPADSQADKTERVLQFGKACQDLGEGTTSQLRFVLGRLLPARVVVMNVYASLPCISEVTSGTAQIVARDAMGCAVALFLPNKIIV